jgi:hypothetical protein
LLGQGLGCTIGHAASFLDSCSLTIYHFRFTQVNKLTEKKHAWLTRPVSRAGHTPLLTPPRKKSKRRPTRCVPGKMDKTTLEGML